MLYLLDGKRLWDNAGFIGLDGTGYPPNWLALTSDDEKQAIGIEIVEEPAEPTSGAYVRKDYDYPPYVEFAPVPLDDLKAAKNKEINAARTAANTGTFSHDGKAFSCDALSRGDVDGMNGYVALYDALPPEFPGAWKAVDNSYYPIADVAAWKAFYASMVAAGTENFAHSEALKAQLAAAATAEEVAAVVW